MMPKTCSSVRVMTSMKKRKKCVRFAKPSSDEDIDKIHKANNILTYSTYLHLAPEIRNKRRGSYIYNITKITYIAHFPERITV